MLASYATAVALNSFLPANIGTWVMLLMFTTLFTGATFTMMLSGIVVQKIPFTVFNLALYLYLFLSVAGSFSVKLGFLADHTGLVVGILIGGASSSSSSSAAIFWPRLAKLRAQVAQGGAVLGRPRRFLLDVVAPSLGSYLARLAIVAVFLGAYGIPASFHNVATVTASNSISNSRLGHARRRRRHPGDELGRALRLDRRGDRHRLLDQPAAGHLGLERRSSPSSSSPGSSAGPAAKRWSGPPTPTRR